MNRIASLCILAYERPEMLMDMIESLHSVDAGYPFELIIHNDGSKDDRVFRYLNNLVKTKMVSFVIHNGGDNMGIGKAMRHCVGVSHGDYIFKLDSDLTFKPNWLKKSVDLLKDEEIGAVCLLDYSNYDPDDERFHFKHDHGDHYLSDNFVSSAYGFRRDVWIRYGSLMGNDGWHRLLHEYGLKLAITKPDCVDNHGFGAKSIYVGKDGKAVDMHPAPLIFS